MTDHLATALGLIGAALMLASYLMKSMLPLRVAALVACCFLVAYGALKQALPTLLLYGALIPINVKKTLQMRQLVKAIERARDDTPVSEWLLPHMHRHTVPAGTVLWRKGDAARDMLYLDRGTLRLVEYDERLHAGALVGEIGLFAPDNRRTLSLEAVDDCVVYRLSAEEMALLYYQNPKLGFHVMRLVVARLMRDSARMRAPQVGAPAEAAAAAAAG
ncbi:Crp/Fnr family transcriptional regulator [Roseateles sp. BYS87W]|uniref:Crp/Fnr family transcriptional regulator n=1 Tax=Pelomonas baiyunensis TaxID=3299026 RepID=A0ABW7GT86_9BURK